MVKDEAFLFFLHQKSTMLTLSLYWDILMMFTSKIFLTDVLLVKPLVHKILKIHNPTWHCLGPACKTYKRFGSALNFEVHQRSIIG